ncbi:hypothetical protein OYT1_ch1299 [Ferriphaselus amnicola]|uniref:Uncharacterized protein n=1 Tax=Ferriphaselus amnicola TaxID=1188319 RepID=A0A2Z6GBL7_9PROT|nr:hypothetical protein [Ferriphaselus amnicola]BBE50856.1 hypothetical protein OYT1_ch1299 [Ferriphaselus amnicola]
MGITKLWLQDQQFARSIERQIDRSTLIDLLGIVLYEADRAARLEDAGFADQAPSVDCLFDYVLDALGIPAENDTFSRESFSALFYNDYWLEHRFESLDMVLTALEELRDSIAARSASAEVLRAGFRVIDPDA